MGQLILSGHSFGGITAVVAAARLPDNLAINAVQVLDPWFYAYEQEFKSGELKVRCPLQIVNTEMFHSRIVGFDSWNTVKAVCNHAVSKDTVENITILKTGHVNQTDVTVLDTWTICVLLGLTPTKALYKVMDPGTFDCSDELLSMMWRSHQGRPLMHELYLLNS